MLIDSCIFSILFSWVLIIFTIIILNSFSGSLPLSSSFIWTAVFSSLFLHLCIISLPFQYIVFTYCVWGLLFPGFKVEFFLPFGFFPSKVSPVVCVSFTWGEICAEFLFVCFSSEGQGWVRWSSCLLMIGFVFLFCLLFRWGVLHRVLLVVGWYWVLFSSGFLCVHSHYLIPPRVSSLVIQGLGVSAPTPKAQGLTHKWVCYSTKWDQNKYPKMGNQRWTPKNGSYKIRQIIIKIMEYTHIHIYPWTKSTQSNKKKVQ